MQLSWYDTRTMNYTFIGMPGAGKSYIGKQFAEAKGMQFIDIDTITEEVYGKSLQAILEELGEDEFLAVQEQIVLQLGVYENTVVSPGGSVVYSPAAMRFLSDTSKIVYLDVSIEVLEKRIDVRTRGIVGLGSRSFADLYEERVKAYKKWAEVTVDSNEDALQQLLANSW